MSHYQLTPLARFDMREIWAYTLQRWGRRMADKYIRELTAVIETAASDPYIGIGMDDLECRKWVFRSHVIYYAVSERGIVVIRVLHQQMDAASHLN